MDSVKTAATKGAATQLTRVQGTMGVWKGMPKQEEIVSALDAHKSLRRIDGVRIMRLLYPKVPEKINKTAVFACGDGDTSVTYRISDDLDRNADLRVLHPFSKTWAGHVSARLGHALDLYHTYTLWIAPNHATPYQGKATQTVVHVEATPVAPIDAHLLLHMISNHPALSKLKIDFRECESVAGLFKFGRIADAVDELATRAGGWATVVSTIPFFRAQRAPLLFRLWPAKQLMGLKYKDFCALATALEKGTLRGHCFAFDWLMPAANLEELDLAQLHTLQYALGYDDRDELVLSEFFQIALGKAKASGHTVSTLEQLVTYYLSQRTYGGPQKMPAFNINTIFGMTANRPYEVAHLTGTIKNLLSLAISNKIVRMRYASAAMPRVLCAVDDAIKEEYVVKFINNFVAKRWSRDIHADGCVTEADVFARIAAGLPSAQNAFEPGVPQWDDASFKEHYKNLDDDQKLAVVRAVLFPVSVIYGPPGSGKTKVGQALFYLFGGALDNVPLAPYGRIAAMWRDLLEGCGFTYHRVSSMVKYAGPDPSPEIKQLKRTTTFISDEFSLTTHHHLYMVFKALGQCLVRIILLGDPFQMGGIGSGRLGRGLYEYVRDLPLATHLSLPHRFARSLDLPRCSADFIWTRPTSPNHPMAIAWNMRQIVNYVPGTAGGLDLVYSTDIQNNLARFVLAPRRFNAATGMAQDRTGLVATLRPILTALLGEEVIGKGEECVRRIGEYGIQILTQRNLDRRAINSAIFEIAYGDPATAGRLERALYVGERITFTVNAYFMGSSAVSDRELEHVNALGPGGDDLQTSASDYARRQAVQDRKLMAAGLAGKPYAPRSHLKRPREEKVSSDDFRKGTSDDVFNGEIRELARVVDISESSGDFREALPSTTERSNQANSYPPGRKKGKWESRTRMLEMFDLKKERKILNTSEYELDNIERAYCLTSAKMQGSEDRVVIYVVAPSPYGGGGAAVNTLFNEELYTVITRGKERMIVVAGRDEQEGLRELVSIASVHEERSRSLFTNGLTMLPSDVHTTALEPTAPLVTSHTSATGPAARQH